MKRLWIPLFAVTLTAGWACDTDDAEVPADRDGAVTPDDVAYAPAPESAAPPSPAKAHRCSCGAEHDAHRVRVPGAQQAFSEVVELIGEHYVDGELDDDVLWTGATQGVLDRLIQLPEHSINTLLSPQQLRELEIGTQGRLVGVGVKIEMVADVVVVRDTIPGGPAEAAKLQAGDRILGVDGERLRGMPLGKVVGKIRGEEGSEIEMFIQRDTEEWTIRVTRGQIEFSGVEGRLLDDGVGYLRVTSFASNTAADVDAQLESLRTEGMKSLVLDLRHCPGGLLDAAVDVTDRFLPAGKAIVTIAGRGEPKHLEAPNTDPWEELPMAVLIGPKTASGAEILAAAVSEHGRATLVGQRTLGKGTVESIHELSNGWAVKLSTSRFHAPSGGPDQPPGVSPDVALAAGDGPATRVTRAARLEQVSPENDTPLAVAMQLLERDE